LIRLGAEAARVATRVLNGGTELELEVVLRRRDGKKASLNGEVLPSAERLRSALPTLVFTPDRLAVVKGGPAVRRAYLDRTLARIFPARAELPREYGKALGQRNACLRKIALDLSSREALEPWSAQVVSLGRGLQQARAEAIATLSGRLSAVSDALGLAGCRLEYAGEEIGAEALGRRLDRDIERGTTGLGPHLDEIAILSGGRDLRSFGSQGEQRTAVLALIIAEAELLLERSGHPPLLLLDDVLSELDLDRRRALVERLGALGQTLITATSEAALPAAPDQLIAIRPGVAETV
jgi:DNA replication and repair protein RecF